MSQVRVENDMGKRALSRWQGGLLGNPFGVSVRAMWRAVPMSTEEEWSCLGKVGYQQQGIAEKAYVKWQKKEKLNCGRAVYYKCGYCGLWHYAYDGRKPMSLKRKKQLWRGGADSGMW